MRTFTRLLVILIEAGILTACTSALVHTTTSEMPGSRSTGPGSLVQPADSTPSTATPPQPERSDQGQLSTALRMNMGRAAHTATLLADGKVLIAGGFREEGTAEIAIASAEVYDPKTNTFSPTGEMKEARSGHTATLLPDGKVLIAGGWGLHDRLSAAELYDPHTGEFLAAASMAAPRAGMTATLLQNGQVLIAGGESADNTPQMIAEIYDFTANAFTLAGSLEQGRSAHTATLLNNGTVLFTGGNTGNNKVLESAEIFDQAKREFTYTGSMNVVRYKHAAALLPDGDVLVVGGSDQNDWRGKYTSAEIYEKQTGLFKQIPAMHAERFKLADAVVLLNNGNVLIGGGNRQLEVFDVHAGRFVLSARLDADYYFSVLTVLKDGRVLITGGYDQSIQPSGKAWIFNNSEESIN
jgi:WD40 repeat protein